MAELTIKSSMYVARNPETGEPHAYTIIEVPYAYAESNPRLSEILNQFSPEERAAMKREGVLRLNNNFTFDEEVEFDAEKGLGVGMGINAMNLDISRMKKPEEKTAIKDWIERHYNTTITDDAQLQTAVNETFAAHICTDMSIACMTENYMMELLVPAIQGKEVELDSFMKGDYSDKMIQSLKDRGILTEALIKGGDDALKDALRAYHAEASQIRGQWPSSTDNYGAALERDETGRVIPLQEEGAVVFFKGFEALGQTVIHAGPYAEACAWPGNDNFSHFENGVPMSLEGERIMHAEADPTYLYTPRARIDRSYKGADAENVIGHFLDMESSPPHYTYTNNCVALAYEAMTGDDKTSFREFLNVIGGMKSEKITNQNIMDVMTQENPPALPEGLTFTQVPYDINTLRNTEKDPNGIRLADTYITETAAGRITFDQIETAVAANDNASLSGVLQTYQQHLENSEPTYPSQGAQAGMAQRQETSRTNETPQEESPPTVLKEGGYVYAALSALKWAATKAIQGAGALGNAVFGKK